MAASCAVGCSDRFFEAWMRSVPLLQLSQTDLHKVVLAVQICSTQPECFSSCPQLAYIARQQISISACMSPAESYTRLSEVLGSSPFSLNTHGTQLAAILAHFGEGSCDDRSPVCNDCLLDNNGSQKLLSACRQVRDPLSGLSGDCCTNCILRAHQHGPRSRDVMIPLRGRNETTLSSPLQQTATIENEELNATLPATSSTIRLPIRSSKVLERNRNLPLPSSTDSRPETLSKTSGLLTTQPVDRNTTQPFQDPLPVDSTSTPTPTPATPRKKRHYYSTDPSTPSKLAVWQEKAKQTPNVPTWRLVAIDGEEHRWERVPESEVHEKRTPKRRRRGRYNSSSVD